MMNKYQALCRTSRRAFWFALSAVVLFTSAAQGMYDPHHGRWFQRDPLGVRPDTYKAPVHALMQYADGPSLLEYARSKSTVHSDPVGLYDAKECLLCQMLRDSYMACIAECTDNPPPPPPHTPISSEHWTLEICEDCNCGADFLECWAKCMEAANDPVQRRAAWANVANTTVTVVFGKKPWGGKSGLLGYERWTSWQHKLGSYVSKSCCPNAKCMRWAKPVGKAAGRAAVTVTLMDGAWEGGQGDRVCGAMQR